MRGRLQWQDRSMDAAGGCVNAMAVATQLSVCRPKIVDVNNVSNIEDVHSATVAAILPPGEKEPTNHESQIFVGTYSRTIALNVNLASDSVEKVKRLIEEREGIPVSEQHLSFGGKPLRHGTSLRDYDALGVESTINVIPRICGGIRSVDMALSTLVHQLQGLTTKPKTWDATTVKVLTEVGGSILHGVLTCILSAHRAGLAFGGACGMDNLMVHVYQGDQPVVSRVYVRDDGGTSSSLKPLDSEKQKADYKALKQAIEVLFPVDDGSSKAQHVGSIYRLLDALAADDDKEENDTAGSVIPKGLLVGRPVRRTHLLQAYAAMVSSPVALATMCFNLKRFFDQLDDVHKPIFTDALRDAQDETRLLCEEVGEQPLFKKVYENPPVYNQNNNVDRSVPDNRYEGGRTGTGLLNFARNWFTHVPEERWNGGAQKFDGLPSLDCIFTYHFPEFIPQALQHLYKKFDDHHSNLLTRVLA